MIFVLSLQGGKQATAADNLAFQATAADNLAFQAHEETNKGLYPVITKL